MAFKPAPDPQTYNTPGRPAPAVAALAVGGLAVRSLANGQKVVGAPVPAALQVDPGTGYPL
jgi:hypothetical protein